MIGAGCHSGWEEVTDKARDTPEKMAEYVASTIWCCFLSRDKKYQYPPRATETRWHSYCTGPRQTQRASAVYQPQHASVVTTKGWHVTLPVSYLSYHLHRHPYSRVKQ